MIDFFDQLYSSIVNKNKLLERIRYYSMLRFIIRLSANIIIPIYFIFTQRNKRYSLLTSSKRESRVIVTLTSFPVRIKRVWIVVESILRQNYKPDMIILWLSLEQFPTMQTLPRTLIRLQKRGLTIRLCKDDLRSHKKYYYTLKEYPNDVMVTIDDDIFYRSNMIEDLYNLSKLYPCSIVCQHAFTFDWSDGELKNYSEWKPIYSEMEPNCKIFFCSGGGTLFPPNTLYKDTLDQNIFLKVTPIADDIWLNAMSRIKGTKIRKTKYSTVILPIMNFKNVTLASKNIGENYNDIQLNALISHYKKEIGINPFLNY